MAENKTVDLKEAAEQAVKLEEAAKAIEDIGHYTYVFKEPFTHGGKTVKELHFDWEKLTGYDRNAIEAELLRDGITLVIPAYTGKFLMHMAVRACTDRDEKGVRIVDREFMQALPLRNYEKIIGRARSFLIQSE